MTFDRNLIAVIVLVLFAMSLLISSLDYSSGIILSGVGSAGSYSYVGAPQAPVNHSPAGNESGESEHPPEKNGGNAGDPWLGLFGRDPGNGDTSADVRDPGYSLLIISMMAVAIAIIGAVTFILVRRRSRKTALNTIARQTVVVPPQSDQARDSFEGLFLLRFPQIREPFPLTWGPDEPLEMAVVCKDGSTVDARLSIDGNEAGIIRLENGQAMIPLKLEKGSHRVTVSPSGDVLPGRESWLNVRIVDYREEVVRVFNEMCLPFRATVDAPGHEMTPREIEHLIGAQLPAAKQTLLDAAVTTFERANYSLHVINRADYEVMYTSARGVT